MNFSSAAKLHLDANEDAVARLWRAIGLNPDFPVMHFAFAGALPISVGWRRREPKPTPAWRLIPRSPLETSVSALRATTPFFVKQHERSADIMRKAGHAGRMSTARVLAFAPGMA